MQAYRFSVLFMTCMPHALDGNVDAVTFGTGTGGTIAGRCSYMMFRVVCTVTVSVPCSAKNIKRNISCL